MKNWWIERKAMAKARKGPYPVHGRSLGYLGTPRTPFTWFVCNNGHREMGTPWAKPEGECLRCGLGWGEGDGEFTAWRVAGSTEASHATMDACGPADGRMLERYARTRA